MLARGGEPTAVTPQLVDALIYDGSLDARFMSGYDIILDLRRERIWWRRVSSRQDAAER